MVQSVAGGEGSVLSRDPSSVSDWWAHSWCCNCNIFPCSCYDINDSTFTLWCRTRISHRLGPGGSTGPCCPSQSLVCMSGQAGPGSRLENCQSHVFGKQSALLCLSPVSTHHTPSLLPPPIQTDSPDVCCPLNHTLGLDLSSVVSCCSVLCSVSATASSLQSRSFQRFKVYVMNVILRGPGIPFI